MNKMINLVAASVLVASASVAMADSTGFYAGVLAGYGKVDYVNGANSNVVNKNHGIDGGLNAGYMFTKNFGVEAGVLQYSKVKLNNNLGSITDNHNIYVAGVAKYNFTNEFNVFGKLGVANVHTKTPAGLTIDNVAVEQGGHSKFTYFAGAGVGYFVTQNVQLSLEGDITGKASVIPAMFSTNVGISYMF